ncbi:hypothetical protein HHL23_13575 [Chryseobacterium sp. RP-3-3]|uniref:F5/8 type C domain-containing protein n=1 Tax=Chryseobacterium antibioticum TaxID=2728847 RepID=A0A7Y0AP79_9FLAO|nr:hypothetical protein [Chryseobacterium antibioticum]NML70817.1 hypothetical protein [Chryseobacterium antibioticum]
MKYLKIKILLNIFASQMLFSQVGIGTSTPNNSAVLDLDVSSLAANNKKGVLLPRVALQNNADITTIQSPVAGLTVYNTTANGSGISAVVANTFYYWNGTNWINLSNITEIKRELLPQVFFLAEGNNGVTTPQLPVSGADNINTAPVLVDFSVGSIVLNSENNISLLNENNFMINNSGNYQISGYLGYNPAISVLTSATNMEFTIQISTDNGTTWSNIAKTVGVWGNGTTANNKTNNIPPLVVGLNKNNLIRCTVLKTSGTNHSASATISSATGLSYGKVLKIQKLD